MTQSPRAPESKSTVEQRALALAKEISTAGWHSAGSWSDLIARALRQERALALDAAIEAARYTWNSPQDGGFDGAFEAVIDALTRLREATNAT